MKLSATVLARIYDLAMESAGGLYTPHGDLSDVKRVVAQAFIDAIDVVLLEEFDVEELGHPEDD